MKDFYTPVMVNLLNKKVPLWAQIKKSTKGVVGKRVVIPVILGFPEGVGAKAPNDYNLPGAQRSTYDQSYITLKRNYGRVMIDAFSVESAKNGGGWVDLLSQETKNATDAFNIDIERQVIGNGKGILALEDGAVAGQVITVKDAGGVTGNTPKTKFLRKGMKLDIYNAAVKKADSVQISGVNAGAGTITVVGDITQCADGYQIYREDTFNGSAYGEIMGIRGIVSAANPIGSDFQGIDRTACPEFCSYVKTSAGVLSEVLMQTALDEIEAVTSGEPVNLAFTTFALRNKLIELVKADRQVTNLDLKAGWKAIKYVGGSVELPLLAHKSADLATITYLSTSHIKVYLLKDLYWEDKGGGIVRPVSGQDAYEAFFKLYAELGTDSPNTMGVQQGVLTA